MSASKPAEKALKPLVAAVLAVSLLPSCLLPPRKRGR